MIMLNLRHDDLSLKPTKVVPGAIAIKVITLNDFQMKPTNLSGVQKISSLETTITGRGQSWWGTLGWEGDANGERQRGLYL